MGNFKVYVGKIGRDFLESFEEVLDVQNAIDHFIFLEFCHLPNDTEPNTQIISYDSQKWFLLRYDLNASPEISQDSSGEIYPSSSILIDKNSDKFRGKVYQAFLQEIENRYIELRNRNILV